MNISMEKFLIISICCITTGGLGGSREINKIVGGIPSTPGEFPWLVAIIESRQFCAGSIISPNWILTAGHCAMKDAKAYEIIAGVYSLKNPNGHEQSREVAKVYKHHNFSALNGVNDIALMRLSTPFKFNDQVTALELVSSGFIMELEATIAGWGVEGQEYTVQPEVLRKVTVPIITNPECKTYYERYGSKAPMQILDSVVCGGGHGRSACFGDSGGPLMVQKKVKGKVTYVVAGLVSTGIRCGAVGVFTRISYYREWIHWIARI